MGWFRKKAKPLVMPPAPWDGTHRLTNITFQELAEWPDDYFQGYRWECACGTMSPALPTRWYTSEELAAQGHRKHAAAYEEAAKHKWGPPPAFYPITGHNG